MDSETWLTAYCPWCAQDNPALPRVMACFMSATVCISRLLSLSVRSSPFQRPAQKHFRQMLVHAGKTMHCVMLQCPGGLSKAGVRVNWNGHFAGFSIWSSVYPSSEKTCRNVHFFRLCGLTRKLGYVVRYALWQNQRPLLLNNFWLFLR